MKKVFYRLGFLFFILFLSCKKESEFEKTLTDKQKKWVYIDNPTFNKNSRIIAYIKFSKANICTNFSIEDHAKMKSGEWNYSGIDSSFSVFGHEYKFLRIEGDSIYVKYKNENFTALFMNIANNKNITSPY